MSRTTFRERSTRVVGEFAVIVIGVLTALAVDSWRQDVEERSREDQYLAQLLDDSRNNLAVLRETLATEEQYQADIEAASAAVEGPGPIIVDSVAAWFDRDFGSYSDPRLRLGTLSALVETGESRLVRDQRVRTEILAYSGQIEEDLDEIDRWVGALPDLYLSWSTVTVDYGLGGGTWARDDWTMGAIAEGHRNRELASVLRGLRTSAYNRAIYLGRMVEATDSLVSVLEHR